MKRPLTHSVLLSTAVALASVLAVGVAAAPAQAASCGKVTYQDGSVGPAVCPNGEANQKVQSAYAKAAPAVMALGADATRAQVRVAVCTDRKAGASGVELYDAVAYQAAAYEWSRRLVHRVNRRLVAGTYC